MQSNGNSFVCENNEKFKKLEAYIDGIEDKNGCLITVLHTAQGMFGYLPKEVQIFIAKKLNLSAAKVYGVVSFYSFFTMEPKGKHVIDVCLGTACYVRGADKVLQELQNQLGINVGQTTPDGRFTLSCLRCVGACGLAPVVIVDDDVHGRVTAEDVKVILEKIVD